MAPHVVGDVHGAHGVTHEIPVVTLDTAGYAASARVVWHQDEIASGKTYEGGEGSALVAAFFLFYLDNEFLTFLDRILDAQPAAAF